MSTTVEGILRIHLFVEGHKHIAEEGYLLLSGRFSPPNPLVSSCWVKIPPISLEPGRYAAILDEVRLLGQNPINGEFCIEGVENWKLSVADQLYTVTYEIDVSSQETKNVVYVQLTERFGFQKVSTGPPP